MEQASGIWGGPFTRQLIEQIGQGPSTRHASESYDSKGTFDYSYCPGSLLAIVVDNFFYRRTSSGKNLPAIGRVSLWAI